MPDRAPFVVQCAGLDSSPATFPSYAAARSYALGIANRENVQCAITDRFGSVSEIVVRSGPVDPLRREYDPNRHQPFFHPNPEHPRSRKRFLRNEPQGWTPGRGPSQTQVRPKDFFGMGDDSTTANVLTAVLPPLALFGVVAFLVRSRSMSGLEDDAIAPRAQVVGMRQMPSQRRRHAARKFYGSHVLAMQSAVSMRKLAQSTGSPIAQKRAVAMAQMSRVLLNDARAADPRFVERKLMR